MTDKSKEKIKEALIALLETDDFEAVTIAEICGWAKLSRGTFYNHFNKKEDVISWISSKWIIEYLENFEWSQEGWFEEIALEFFVRSKEHRDFLELITRQGLFYLYVGQLFEVFMKHPLVINRKSYVSWSENKRSYVIRTYIGSALAVYEVWSGNKYDLSVEEVTELYLQFVHHPSEFK